MVLKLPYGRRGLAVELPDDARVIEPHAIPSLRDESASIAEALEYPIDSKPLRELVANGARVGIVVCDVTRPFPARRILPVLLTRLGNAEVTVFVATGTHRMCTPRELESMLGPAVLSRCRVVQHDAFDRKRHTELGTLADTGGRALVDAEFLRQDVRITTGFIEPHFFAGFSGGPKMVAPGLAAIETVLDLHSSARIGDRNARWGVTQANPVHDGIRDIAARANVTFNLDVTLDRQHRCTGVFAGDLFASHAAGCGFALRTAMVPANQQFEVVVTTNSGYPLDQNLYQTVKGMSAAAQIVKDGGTIVLVAECCDGLPEHGLYKELLREAAGPDDFLRMLAQPGFARHDQWQVQVQAQIQKRARVCVKSDGLSADELRSAWLEPVDDIPALLQELGGTVAVLPDGPQTIPYLATSST